MLAYKSLILIVFSTLLISQKVADGGKSYTYDDGGVDVLNGHVKQIVALRQSVIGEGFNDTITTVFDKNGHQVEVLTALVTGKKSKEKFINNFDQSGRVTQTKKEGSRLKGVYSYGKTGYTIKVQFNPDNPQGSQNVYSYDKDGYLTEFYYYESPKVLVDIIKYKYDQSHRLISSEQRSAKGELKLTQTFQYLAFSVDSKNNWVKEKVIIKDVYPAFVNTKTHNLSRKIYYY